MLFIFSTPVLIKHMWQLKTVVFLHWCLLCTVLLLLNAVRNVCQYIDCRLMLSVIMLCVIMLSVVAPFHSLFAFSQNRKGRKN